MIIREVRKEFKGKSDIALHPPAISIVMGWGMNSNNIVTIVSDFGMIFCQNVARRGEKVVY